MPETGKKPSKGSSGKEEREYTAILDFIIKMEDVSDKDYIHAYRHFEPDYGHEKVKKRLVEIVDREMKRL